MLTLMTLLESITKHQRILSDVELDGVLSILLSNVVGEGSSHGWFADEYSIEHLGALCAFSGQFTHWHTGNNYSWSASVGVQS